MTDETNAQQGADANAPATTNNHQQAPRSDADAAQREAAEKTTEPTDAENAAKAEDNRQAEEKRKQGNRTGDYIKRINAENAELRRYKAEQEARQQPHRSAQPQQQRQGPPTLEEHSYDFASWSEANSVYQRQQWQKEQEQAAKSRQQEETQARYNERTEAFADANPDFFEAVGLIDPSFLTAELQAAIIGHEKGPEIAYHLANNEDALWDLASVRADLLPAAVGRLASRLGAAPPAQQSAIAPASQQQTRATKPISQAPAPAPIVGGRSPTETPSEKLTDDEWYKRDMEKRRKR